MSDTPHYPAIVPGRAVIRRAGASEAEGTADHRRAEGTVLAWLCLKTSVCPKTGMAWLKTQGRVPYFGGGGSGGTASQGRRAVSA
jgi:hypothetical protein